MKPVLRWETSFGSIALQTQFKAVLQLLFSMMIVSSLYGVCGLTIVKMVLVFMASDTLRVAHL
jgi:hypothetical protein